MHALSGNSLECNALTVIFTVERPLKHLFKNYSNGNFFEKRQSILKPTESKAILLFWRTICVPHNRQISMQMFTVKMHSSLIFEMVLSVLWCVRTEQWQCTGSTQLPWRQFVLRGNQHNKLIFRRILQSASTRPKRIAAQTQCPIRSSILVNSKRGEEQNNVKNKNDLLNENSLKWKMSAITSARDELQQRTEAKNHLRWRWYDCSSSRWSRYSILLADEKRFGVLCKSSYKRTIAVAYACTQCRTQLLVLFAFSATVGDLAAVSALSFIEEILSLG